MDSSKARKLAIAFFCVVIVVGVLPLLADGFFAHPTADDFNYSMDYMRPAVLAGEGFFGLVQAAIDTSVHFYNTWQGLYTSAFVLALQPGIFGDQYYFITVFLLAAFLWGGFASITYVLTKYGLRSPSKTWIPLSLVLWFYCLQTLPSPVEGLYWWNGAMNYTLLWSFYMFTTALTIVSLGTRGAKSVVFLVLATLMAFITAGGNHMTTVACIATLLLLLILQIWRQRRCALLLPLIVCSAGLAIVMMAPGTGVRAEALGVGASGSLLTTIANLTEALIKAIEYGGQWLDLSWLAFAVAIIPFAVRLWRTSQRSWRPCSPFLAVVGAASFVLIAVMLCPPYYAMGRADSGRIQDVLYYTFLVESLVLILSIIGWLLQRWDKNAPGKASSLVRWSRIAPAYITAGICLGIVVLSFGSGFNFHRSTWIDACDDLLTGEARLYSQEIYERVELLEGDETDVVLPAVSVEPKLLYFENPDYDPENPDYWMNLSMAQYYGKDSVRIVDDGHLERDR